MVDTGKLSLSLRTDSGHREPQRVRQFPDPTRLVFGSTTYGRKTALKVGQKGPVWGYLCNHCATSVRQRFHKCRRLRTSKSRPPPFLGIARATSVQRVAKTVADCLNTATKSELKRWSAVFEKSLRQKRCTCERVRHFARICRVSRILNSRLYNELNAHL